jgi:hypothetical protein
MARSRVEVQDLSDETQKEAEELAQLNEDEAGELFKTIDDLRITGGVTVVIVKLSPKEDQGYCATVPIGEFTHDMLRDTYGAGTYRIRIRGPKGYVPGGGTVKVSGSGLKRPAAPGAAGGDFQTALEFLRQQQTERDAKSSKLLELAIPTLGTVLAAFLNRPQSSDIASLVTALKPVPGPTLAEISQMMINFKTLSTPEKSESSVESFIKIFEAAKDLAGDGGGGGKTGWLDLAKEAMGALPQVAGPLLQGIAARRSITPAAVTPPAIPIAAPLPDTQKPTSAAIADIASAPAAKPAAIENQEMMFFKPMIQAKLKIVSQWIQEQKAPELYAEIFLREHVPSTVQDFLPPEKALEYLKHERWYEAVCEWEPTLSNHREWCDRFRLELIGFIEDSMNPPDDELPEHVAAG